MVKRGYELVYAIDEILSKKESYEGYFPVWYVKQKSICDPNIELHINIGKQSFTVVMWVVKYNQEEYAIKIRVRRAMSSGRVVPTAYGSSVVVYRYGVDGTVCKILLAIDRILHSNLRLRE